MSQLILFFTVFCVGYLGFMAIVFIFQKLFFPFFTKEELERRAVNKEAVSK